ncbi:MAG: YraN family protein [Clostridiaceae bacterium]|nr:YraN family protein [Clostridiaceae bacterium]
MISKLLGRYGEHIAADFLRKKGYAILAAGYRGPYGEIDIIARKGCVVSFVEVKTRKNQGYLPANTAVGAAKRKRIMLTAQQWIDENQCTEQLSFDIIEVYTDDKTIRHIKDAFV